MLPSLAQLHIHVTHVLWIEDTAQPVFRRYASFARKQGLTSIELVLLKTIFPRKAGFINTHLTAFDHATLVSPLCNPILTSHQQILQIQPRAPNNVFRETLSTERVRIHRNFDISIFDRLMLIKQHGLYAHTFGSQLSVLAKPTQSIVESLVIALDFHIRHKFLRALVGDCVRECTEGRASGLHDSCLFGIGCEGFQPTLVLFWRNSLVVGEDMYFLVVCRLFWQNISAVA